MLLPARSETIRADHLAGGDMSLRRRSFERFDDNFRDYWHKFEQYPASVKGLYDNTRDGNLQQ